MMHHQHGQKMQRIALTVALILVTLVLQGAQPTPASAATAPDPHGPAPGSGTKTTPPFVRVLDGKSIETILDGAQIDIVIVGIDVSPGNSACGKEATRQLTALAQGGLILEEDSAIAYDAAYRRLYSARTHDGRVVAEELVKAGVAKVNGVGEPRHQYDAAEADARAAKRGCLWNGGQATNAAAPAAVQTNAAPAANLPGGFRLDAIAAGLATPTGFAFVPGRRIFITEKSGRVRLVDNGILQTNPVIDITNRVNSYRDRGLNGMAVDPNFATNGYLYLIYTYENDPSAYDGPKTARVARYTVVGDTASPASEVVILGTTVGSSCNNFAAGTDCIVSDGSSHSVGSLRFASDGTLFVSFGDGASFNYVDDNALRTQNPDILSGKLLHVTTAGQGVGGNPFADGNARANRSKVWAYGFRNPFRFSLRPGSDTPYVGDVGWDTWEEVDAGVKGGNYGWPCYEGVGQQGGYASKSACQALYNQGTGAVQPPLTTYNHNGQGAAVVGGVFYTGTNYPAQYRGAYFYADYARSVINTLTVDGNNALTGGPTQFATNADGPVDFAVGPDSDLYYIAINTGELRHIVYASAPTQPIIPKASANVVQGAAPLTVQFSSAGTTGPVGQTISFDWEFDDGTPGTTQANPTHTYTNPGVYDPVLFAYDGSGNTPPTSVIEIRVGTPPTPTISAPSPSLTYAVGDTINFAGSATDQVDGTIPGPQLTWQVIQHHCPGGVCHTHNYLTTAGTGGSFTIPDHGDEVYYEIILTAVDSAGLTGTTSVSIRPKAVHLTLNSSPAGQQVVYNGTAYTAPVTITTVPGSVRTISTGSSQGFYGWSDGGTRQHDITIGAADASYTATFVAAAPPVRNPPGPSSTPAAPAPQPRPGPPQPAGPPNPAPAPLPPSR